MQPSEELKNIVMQNYNQHFASCGSLEVVQRCYFRQEGVIFLGNDPKELLEGYNPIHSYVESAGSGNMPAVCKIVRFRKTISLILDRV